MKRFDDSPDRYTRALQIWQVLIAQAARGETMTYRELAMALGFRRPGTLGQFLDPVMSYCREETLPPLTVLVVNQATGRPGLGLPGIKDLNIDQRRVFDYPWFQVFPPTPEEFREVHQRGRA